MCARITTSSVHLAWTLSRDRNDINALNCSDSCTHVGPQHSLLCAVHALCTFCVRVLALDKPH